MDRASRSKTAPLARPPFPIRGWRALALVTAWLAAPAVVAAQPVARFVSPVEGEIVAGLTEVRLEILDGAAPVERIEVAVDGETVGTARPPGFAFVWLAPATGLAGRTLHAAIVVGGEVVERLSLRTSNVRVAGGRSRDPGARAMLNRRAASFHVIARRIQSPFLCANVRPSSSYNSNAPSAPG